MLESKQHELEPLDVLWTPAQTAKYFGVSTQTIWRWLRRGVVFNPAAVVRLNNIIKIPRSEIARITEQKKQQLNSLSNNND